MTGFTLGAESAPVSAAMPDDPAVRFIARVLPENAGEGRRIGLFWFPNDDASWASAKAKGMPRPPTSGRAFSSPIDAARFMRWSLGQQHQSGTPYSDFYICMALCGMETQGISKTGRTYFKPARSQNAHRASRTLYADMDVKPGAYATKADAKAALDAAVAGGALPPPTVLVDSGNGLHAHWVLDRELTRLEWESLAHPFAAYLTKTLGLHIDTACTRDSVRILRVPGAWNAKDRHNPVPTALIGDIRPDDIPVADIEALLGVKVSAAGSNVVAFPGARPVPVPGQPFTLPPAFDGAVSPEPLPAAPMFSGGIDPDLHGATPPVDIAKAVAACLTLSGILARGGAGDSEPLWNLAMLVASFAPEHERSRWAHDFSKGYATYNPDEVDAKLAAKVNARLTSGGKLGWPSCRTFAAHSPACATCPLLAQDRSPLNQGVVVVTPPPAPDALPDGYARDGLRIVQHVQDEDGNAVTIEVLPHDITDACLEDRADWVFFSATVRHHNNPDTRLRLPLSAATAWRDEATKALANAQVVLLPEQIQPARRFFVAFIHSLQRRAPNVQVRDAFGWVRDRYGRPGFAFDGRVFTATGEEPAAAADEHFKARFHVTGKVEAWKVAAETIMGMNRIDLQAAIATAFAAPLIRFSGENGVIVSIYSPFSGVQKSSAIKVAQAVWGDPRSGMTRLDDTANAVGRKLGLLRHLPVYWDELQRRDQTEVFAKVAFALTQGTEKARMGADTKLRHSGEWATMLVCGSNHSIREIMLGAQAEASAAGVARVFEIEVSKVPVQTSAAEAAITLSQTHENYGVVGVEYARFLAQNHDKIQTALRAVATRFERDAGSDAEQRFWIAAASTIYLGAVFANKLMGGALIQFPLPQLYTFLLNTIKVQQAARTRDVVDFGTLDNAVRLVQDYIDHCRANHTMLETDTAPKGAGRPAPVQLRGVTSDAHRHLRAPVAHILHDDGQMRILIQHFRRWIAYTKQMSYDMVMRDLEKFGAATRGRSRWAAGTPWAGSLTDYIVLDTHYGRTPLGAQIGHGK